MKSNGMGIAHWLASTGENIRLLLVSRLAYVIVIAALLGCQSPSPRLRSKADVDTYSRLSTEERAAVDAGVLRKGMTPETVRLAWGRPTRKRLLVDQGKQQTEWSYYGTRWVDEPTWDYTSYMDRYGNPTMEFRMKRVGIPFLRARAVFENEQVVDWEETRP
jgi:hypothetical protein